MPRCASRDAWQLFGHTQAKPQPCPRCIPCPAAPRPAQQPRRLRAHGHSLGTDRRAQPQEEPTACGWSPGPSHLSFGRQDPDFSSTPSLPQPLQPFQAGRSPRASPWHATAQCGCAPSDLSVAPLEPHQPVGPQHTKEPRVLQAKDVPKSPSSPLRRRGGQPPKHRCPPPRPGVLLLSRPPQTFCTSSLLETKESFSAPPSPAAPGATAAPLGADLSGKQSSRQA